MSLPFPLPLSVYLSHKIKPRRIFFGVLFYGGSVRCYLLVFSAVAAAPFAGAAVVAGAFVAVEGEAFVAVEPEAEPLDAEPAEHAEPAYAPMASERPNKKMSDAISIFFISPSLG